jgi:hypothetical protein
MVGTNCYDMCKDVVRLISEEPEASWRTQPVCLPQTQITDAIRGTYSFQSREERWRFLGVGVR